jgi:hypothetical protein
MLCALFETGPLRLLELLLEVGFFTGQSTQVVKLRPVGFRMPLHNDFIHPWGVKEECSLDADAVRGSTPDSKIGIISAFSHPDDCTLKFLNAFAVTFFDSDMYTDLIAGFYFGYLWIIASVECFI